MEQLQINCPEGYEIDQDKFDLSKGVVYFKKIKKKLTYNNIAEKLFGGKGNYACILNSEVFSFMSKDNHIDFMYDSDNSTTKEQLESILALNKLCNVAKYLNDNWLPTGTNIKFFLGYNRRALMPKELKIIKHETVLYSCVYFKSRELALQAIEILGEEEIKKALTLNH